MLKLDDDGLHHTAYVMYRIGYQIVFPFVFCFVFFFSSHSLCFCNAMNKWRCVDGVGLQSN